MPALQLRGKITIFFNNIKTTLASNTKVQHLKNTKNIRSYKNNKKNERRYVNIDNDSKALNRNLPCICTDVYLQLH